VYVLLDANVATNPKVKRAQSALMAELDKRNCDTLLCHLPEVDGVNGPDDYIAVCGDEAMARILANAHAEADLASEFSDDALALTFTAQYCSELRYTEAWGSWSEWDGTRWKPDDTRKVFDLARRVCRDASSNCEKRLALRIASAATVAAVERLARSDRRHTATVEQWDADPWLLNTPGGAVDLTTGEIRAARREDYCTKITTAVPGGNCRMWFEFLARITDRNEALQYFIQRMCGYALTGITREHALFFLYGTGANGKSVFINTISGVMSGYARTAPIETFIASASERHPTDLAGLRGARLITAVETEDGRRWAESKLKTLTGGDRIAARFMRQDFFEFTPQFKLLIAGNHKPGLRSVDEAMRRRLKLLPFTVTIPAPERDFELTDKLRAEGGGILKWMIEGCLSWQREGLNAPEVVTRATEEYLASEDVLARWLEDCCVIKLTFWTATSALFKSWRDWCDRNEEYSCSQRRFSEQLESRGFAARRTNKARGFDGIGLVTDVTG
jgi:putative DNA primase/helicase